MKKVLAIVLAALLLVGCMAACTSSAQPAASSSAAPASSAASKAEETPAEDDPTQIKATLNYWHGAGDEIRWSCFDKGVEEFNKKYPNVEVISTNYDNDTYKTKIKTVLGAGGNDIPDIFMSWGGDFLGEYVEEGLVIDMTELFAPYKDEYYDYAFGISTFDEKIYGVGYSIAPSTVYYNKSIFEAQGLEVPTTYEELDAVCAKLVDAGITPFALANKSMWPGLLEFTMLTIDMGGQEFFEQLKNREIPFNNDIFVEAGKKLVDFSNKGYYPTDCNGIDYNAGAGRMMFYTEMCAMIIQTNGFISNCKNEDPDFYEEKLGIFYYPAVSENTGAVVAGGNVFSISSECEYPELAAELVYYLTGDIYSQAWIDQGGGFSAAKNVTITEPKVLQQFETLQAAEWTQNFFDQAYVADLGKAFNENTQAIYGGTKTPEEAMAAIEEAAVAAYGPVK